MKMELRKTFQLEAAYPLPKLPRLTEVVVGGNCTARAVYRGE